MKTKSGYGCWGNFMMYVLAGIVQIVVASGLNGVFGWVFRNSVDTPWQQLLSAFLIPFVILNVPLFFLTRSWWYRFGIATNTLLISALLLTAVY